MFKTSVSGNSGLLIFLLCMPAMADSIQSKNSMLAAREIYSAASSLPSISARHIRWHEPSEIELLRATIELSQYGFRVRQSSAGDRHKEMLQNFVANEAWLVDHKRSIAHRLQVEDEFDDNAPRPGDFASFLSEEPCGPLLKKTDAGLGQWRGRDVHAWHCQDQNNAVVTIEFVDNAYGIVVYRRTENGQIDELRHLQERKFSVEHFKPHKDLRLVTRQEFFGGAPEISIYGGKK